MMLGIEPIHVGILVTVNMEVGLCHPPVGLNLYVASGITKLGMPELSSPLPGRDPRSHRSRYRNSSA
jgi:TRAP-type C4-dicarboxylate transport system permease large subunit